MNNQRKEMNKMKNGNPKTTMKLNFLENGVDSLRKGYASLVDYEELFFKDDPSSKKKRAYHLKDAILFTQHGIEILIKKIIQNHSEYLIFSQIDDNVKSAIKQKNQRKLSSVFETDLKHKIHTVNFGEAIERLKIIPSVSLSANLEKRLLELEAYRNIIMHSEPHFNEPEINATFEGLIDELDNFFYDNIEKYKTISGYSDLVKNKEKFKKVLKEKGLELKARAIEIFTSALKKARISIGVNEIKRITDINSCTKFLNYIFDAELLFGTDLYNGFSSGNVVYLKRKSDDLFEMYMEDNNLYAIFKFKSMILYIPEIENDQSPIIFIESAEIDHKADEYKNADIEDYGKAKYLIYFKNKETGEIISDIDRKDEIQNSTGYYDIYYDYAKFFSKGIFCFLNIQGLEYIYKYDDLVENSVGTEGKAFEVALRKAFKNAKNKETS